MLMDRIFPPDIEAFMVRDGKVVVAPSNNEIGFYSTLLADTENKTELLNFCYALLMRTKQSGVDEGGVNAGFSVIDSPFVTDAITADNLGEILPVFKQLKE